MSMVREPGPSRSKRQSTKDILPVSVFTNRPGPMIVPFRRGGAPRRQPRAAPTTVVAAPMSRERRVKAVSREEGLEASSGLLIVPPTLSHKPTTP
jgi:hypothetical protein